MKKEFDKTGPNQQGLVSNIKDQTIKTMKQLHQH